MGTRNLRDTETFYLCQKRLLLHGEGMEKRLETAKEMIGGYETSNPSHMMQAVLPLVIEK